MQKDAPEYPDIKPDLREEKEADKEGFEDKWLPKETPDDETQH